VTLGAEPKKVAILAAIVVGGGLYYFLSSGDSAPAPVPRPIAPVAGTTTRAVTKPAKAQTVQANGGEFKPRIPGSRPDDKVEIDSIDPELHLDLLAKVQSVAPLEAGRNLFQYGAAPPPPTMVKLPDHVPPIAVNHQPPPPQQLPPVVARTDPQPPAAPPINLKYYGYVVSKTDGRKEACLLDGEEIILATENQTVKQRYKIVRIALTSIVIEDTQAKSTQTLQFQDTPAS
jgi:hypothetical protein